MVAPASVHDVLASSGHPLDPATRAFMEAHFGHDFSEVRVHADARAAESAEAVNSHAFTVGRQIVFGRGRYAPHTSEGARLLGHELTHTIQQSGAVSSGHPLGVEPPRTSFERIAEERADRLGNGDGAPAPVARLGAVALQRQPKTDEPEPNLPPGVGVHDEFFKRMLSHENYVDNHIRLVEYFFGEMARIHYYGDDLYFDLQLSPVRAPFAEIDFHTPREDFRPVFDRDGSVGFLREADLANVPRSMPIAEVFRTYARPVQFVVGPDLGGRIVPTRLNMLTAPTLCGVLLDSERKYEENVDMAVQVGLGGTIAIGGYAGAGGIPKPLGGLGTAAVGRLALSAEARSLAREMDALLSSGGTRTLTVKEVQLAGVSVSRQGDVLTVSRFMSKLPEHLRGKGTGMQVTAAFEQAAAEVGRLNGAKTVLIDVGIIINPGWRTLLEGRGYVHLITEGRWVKTIEL